MVINGDTLLYAAPIKNMEPSKIKYNGVSYGLSEAGYDIRIKQDIHFRPNEFIHSAMDVKVDSTVYRNTKFILASAIEEFQMPSSLVGIVHDKSTWARQGLSVFNTVIEPGFIGGLTLELVYHGNKELLIPAGSGIAQVIFHDVKHFASYSGKYQFQSDEPVPAIFERNEKDFYEEKNS